MSRRVQVSVTPPVECHTSDRLDCRPCATTASRNHSYGRREGRPKVSEWPLCRDRCFITGSRKNRFDHERSCPSSNQWRYSWRYRDLQHCWFRFAPRRDRRLLDRLKVIEAGSIAPIPFRNRDNVKARDAPTPGTPSASSSTAKDLRMQIFFAFRDDEQNRKMQLCGRPKRLKPNIGTSRRNNRDHRTVAPRVALGKRNDHCRWKIPAEDSARERVERARFGDGPCRVKVRQIRGALLEQD